MLLNNNKYILITPKLYDLISDKSNEEKEEAPFKFSIFCNDITLICENNDKLNLTFHNNIILDENSITSSSCDHRSFNEIEKIRNSINCYFVFENDFIKDLEDEILSLRNGFLVDESWLNEWKKYSNYDKIKEKYLKNEKESDNETKIINEIIDYREENENTFKLPKIERILNINKKEELDAIVEFYSLVIINSQFIESFLYFNKNAMKGISYRISNNKIKINFKDEHISFESNNNIIQQKNKNKSIAHLKILIKIYYFQKQLYDYIENKKTSEIKNNDIFLINKNIIKKYKNDFNYKTLCDYLNCEVHKLEAGGNKINYQNLSIDIMSKIIKLIYEKYKNIHNNIFAYSNNSNNFEIIEKQIEIISSHKIKHITNFEIVDEDIFNIIKENNIIQTKNLLKAKYLIKEGKIFIYFNFENKNYYEIRYINLDNNFIIEYLIEEMDSSYKDDIINLSYIIYYMLKNIACDI